MRRKWLCLVIVAALGTATAAPVESESVKEGLAKLTGTWKVKEWKRNGEDVPAEDAKVTRFIINGDKIIVDTGTKKDMGTITIDPKKKPATIDIKSETYKVTLLCIYELDKDSLKICFPIDAKEKRPTKFGSTKDDDTGLLVLERETP
jgi:uncharacterized protein (TIGR03067 family)